MSISIGGGGGGPPPAPLAYFLSTGSSGSGALAPAQPIPLNPASTGTVLTGFAFAPGNLGVVCQTAGTYVLEAQIDRFSPVPFLFNVGYAAFGSPPPPVALSPSPIGPDEQFKTYVTLAVGDTLSLYNDSSTAFVFPSTNGLVWFTARPI